MHVATVAPLHAPDALMGYIGEDGHYHPSDEDVERIMRRVAHHRYTSDDPDFDGCNKCGLTREYHLHVVG